MPRKRRKQKDKERLREEALRPSPHLGFRDFNLGVYFLRRRAFKFAEAQFRRAVWLNPYEPLFLSHLAICLYELGQMQESRKLALIVAKAGKLESVRELLELLDKPFKQRYQEKIKGEG